MLLEEFEQAVHKVLAHLPKKYRKILQDKKIEIISRENVPRAVKILKSNNLLTAN